MYDDFVREPCGTCSGLGTILMGRADFRCGVCLGTGISKITHRNAEAFQEDLGCVKKENTLERVTFALTRGQIAARIKAIPRTSDMPGALRHALKHLHEAFDTPPSKKDIP